MRTIAVIGATGTTGRRTCEAAVGRGLRVVAIDRDQPPAKDRRDGIGYHAADVLEDDLAPMIEGCDAVVSTLGLHFGLRTAFNPPPLYTKGTANVMDAMRGTGIRRLAAISAAFVVHQPALPAWFELTAVPALHAILEQMRSMERQVAAATDLDWTLARPGWLRDADAGGALVANDDGLLSHGAFRCRTGDLARFLVDAVADGRSIGQRPALGAPDSAFYESPLALCGMV